MRRDTAMPFTNNKGKDRKYMIVIMLGAPATGKGTVAGILAKELNIPTVSSGDIFRKAIQEQTELGKEVPSYSLYLLINQGLYAKLDGRLKESEKYFKESLRYKLTNNQLYLVGKNLSQVSRNLDKDTLNYVSIDAEPLYKRFFENNICLSTLRFWE